MSTALTVSHNSPAPAIPIVDAERARGFANAEKAAATRRAYGTDFAIFRAWCVERGLGALPATPATVCAFLAAQAGLGKRASTLGRRVAAIGYFHRLAAERSPIGDETIKATLSGIRRSIGAAPVRKRAARRCGIRLNDDRFITIDCCVDQRYLVAGYNYSQPSRVGTESL
jgi:hypothetical protein